MSRQRMGWVKLVALGDGEVTKAQETLELGITPVVRLYRERPGNSPVDSAAYRQCDLYRSMGVRWFEYYNEPNLDAEWPWGADYNPRRDGVVGPLMDHWLTWAEYVVSIDAYPGFPALADNNDGHWQDTITWVDRMLTYLADNHYDRFRAVLDNGCYIATHPYIYNHFHQEMPGGGPRSARSPLAQNVAEGGWHFEYPYDPISQYDDPGRTVWGGTPTAPHGDTVCLLGSGIAIMERLQSMFGVGAIPVVGTEGGIQPPPNRQGIARADGRFPGVTWDSHAHATVAMFEWIATAAPPWMFGISLWKFDDYYRGPEGPLAVQTMFEQRAPIYKDVPAIPALTDTVEEIPVMVPQVVPGPGPIHGAADLHFVFLAPGLDSNWFFDIAESYWDAFKPTLMTTLEFIDFLPSDKSLVVTAITPPDMVEWIQTSITSRWPNVWLDIILITHPDDLAQQLTTRVSAGRRF